MPHPYDLEDAEWFINHINESFDEPLTEKAFAITRREDDLLIGVCGIHPQEHRRAEVGYWIGCAVLGSWLYD